MSTLDNVLLDTKKKMRASIEMLKKEMATVRTGRANASILDSVQVEYYGSMLPINQMGNMSVPEGSLLVITPFDKTAIKAIELAIQKSGLGLNPGSDGNVVRVPIPALTEERRKELVKTLHKMGEDIKTAIRNVRRDANKHNDAALKEKVINEDTHDQTKEEIQNLTKQYEGRVNALAEAKETDIMES